MLFFRRVSGESMLPTLQHDDIIIGWRSRPRIGDVVIAAHSGREIIKRVTRITKRTYYLEGDNAAASTDSRQFGFVDESAILGSMKFHLATSTEAPRPRNRNAIIVGWVAAAIMVLFAVIHLFRIDTFVPELDWVLPGGRDVATVSAALIVVAEVFAVPFLLRMKLSALARILSAKFAVVVPLFWLLLSIWNYGLAYSTAQLGEFVSLPSTWLLIIMNMMWLSLNMYALYVLQPSWSKELRKR